MSTLLTAVLLLYLFASSVTGTLFLSLKQYHRSMPLSSLFERLTGFRNCLPVFHEAGSSRSAQVLRLGSLSNSVYSLIGGHCMSENHASPPQSASEPTGQYGLASTLSGSQFGSASTSQTSSHRGSRQRWPYSVNPLSSQNTRFGQLLTLSQDYDNSPPRF